jgi:hypothetical protein
MQRLILLVLMLAAFPAAAQESTPEATAEVTPEATREIRADFLLRVDAEAIFPLGVRFAVDLDLFADEIERVTLTVELPNADIQRFRMDIDEDNYIVFPYTGLHHFMLFDRETAPPFFSDIFYTWEATSILGSTVERRERVVFADQQVVWTNLRDDPLRLNIGAAFGVTPPAGVLPIVRQAFDALERDTGETRAYNWLLYDLDVPIGCQRGADNASVLLAPRSAFSIPCNAALIDQILSDQGYTIVSHSSAPDLALDDLLIAAMVRDFYGANWEERGVPVWFVEGFTQFYAVNPKADNRALARELLTNNNAFTLDELQLLPADTDQLRPWRAQSHSLIIYIVDRVGIAGLRALAADDQPFAESYQAIMGDAPANLLRAWQRWLPGSAADRAYNSSPYLAPTRTPSLTRTPSHTWTPTPTATSTPSITPTVTGFLSPTPVATVTNTPTPDGPTATPSVTPRPPGSLPTVTPAPPPTIAESLAQPGVQSLILIGLIVILLVLVIAAWRIGRQ